jgi:RNA polymerase sigma-70 factor, ECF subfamily
VTPPFAEPLPELHQHVAFVRAIARRLVADSNEVDDLVQETCLRALAPPPRLASVRAWLATIVRNVCRDRRRAERTRREREHELAAMAARRTAANGDDGDDFGFAMLTRALQALPAEYRRVLQLRYYAELSPPAIAREIGAPLATVKARLVRARQLLRADLDARHGRSLWRAALAPLALNHAPAGSAVLVAATAFLMSKIWISATAACAAVLIGWLLWDGSELARAPQPTNGGSGQPMAAVEHAPVRPSPSSPPAHEVRTLAIAAPSLVPDGELVRGRVVYRTTGQGVPFAIVRLRAGDRAEELAADFDGEFTSPSPWPADVAIAIPGTALVRVAPNATTADSGEDSELVEAATVATAGLAPAAPPAKGGDVAFAPLTAVAVDTAEGWRVAVDAGPTFLVRAHPHERLVDRRLRVHLDKTPSAATTRWPQFFSGGGPLRPVPGVDGTHWWRATTDEVRSKQPFLVVGTTDGFQVGEVQASACAGVVGPLDVKLVEHGIVVGSVRDESGATLAEHQVIVTTRAGEHVYRHGAVTDARGDFTLPMVWPGAGDAHVSSERVDANSTPLFVAGGQPTRCDLVVKARPPGGSISGTITTSSGRRSRSVGVRLTSADDASLWRNEAVKWREDGDPAVGTFTFNGLPGIPCNVKLLVYGPCRIPVRVLQATAPAAGLHFHIDDSAVSRRVEWSVLSAASGQKLADWCLVLRGDDGWEMRLDARYASEGVDLPQLPGEWQLIGANVRRQRGRIEAITGNRVELRAEPGWAGLVGAMDIDTFHAACGAEVHADGVAVGCLDRNGQLLLDLPAPPRVLTFGPHWTVFGDDTYCSDVAADGSVTHQHEPYIISVYLRRTQ